MTAFRRTLCLCATPILVLALFAPALAQSCLTADDMDAATRSALTATAKRYFDMAARGDTASLQQNSIPSVAANFSGIEGAIKDHQPILSGAQANPRPPFLLKAEGTAALDRAEFLCGVFGPTGQTADSAVFVLNNLPPGSYAIDTLDVTSPKGPHTLSFVLQQIGNDWKVGGVYIKASQIAGHDGQWYAERAREFKAKNQPMNAWFYFVEARDLLVPVPFMSTRATDRLYDESQNAKPADFPTTERPLALASSPVPVKSSAAKPGEHFSGAASPSTYQIIDMFPTVVGNDFDLVVKYRVSDISDTAKCFQENMAVIRAIVVKYPELHDSFVGIVARAVAPSGQDYGSLLAMKDIK
jgi:hypothetical protein